MQKKILIFAFIAIIIVTIVLSAVSAFKEYERETARYDILEGFGASVIIILGVAAVHYEADLLYTLYYFFFLKKTKLRTVLNVVANICLISVPVYLVCSNSVTGSGRYEFVSYALFGVYVVLRAITVAGSVMAGQQ